MFSLNQKVVYPGHGVAQVVRIFEKKFRDQAVLLCELKFINKDMTVMVSQTKAVEVGVRALSSSEDITTVLESLIIPARKAVPKEIAANNWNRRNKEYQNKLRTGSLKDISEIYRDLKSISSHKELSFGEKNLLQKTEGLLVEEISAAESMEEEKAVEKLRAFFIPAMRSNHMQA
jgi:CarD family transcriptional regulator